MTAWGYNPGRMFSGIVESVQPILEAGAAEGVVRIRVKKPADFNDLKNGDSIAIDGVCLTVEEFSDSAIQFALAAETLKILRWPDAAGLVNRQVNLERSLRYGDRIHGHLVSGHVDSLATVTRTAREGESFFLFVDIPASVRSFVWNKGSITLNGVSLTVNNLVGNEVEVCLIPETQKRTNLANLKAGDFVNVEPDWMAKALTKALQTQLEGRMSAPEGHA